MKKLMNFRPALVSALSLMCGILLGYAAAAGLYGALISAFSVLLLALILVLVFKKKLLAVFILCAVFLAAGVIGVQVEKFHSDVRQEFFGDAEVSGYVSGESVDYGDYWLVVLRDARVENESGEKNLEGNLTFFVNEKGNDIQVGAYVTMTADVRAINIFRDGVDTFAYKNRNFYRASDVRGVAFGEAEPTLREKIAGFIKTRISANMDAENAEIATSLVLGSRVRVNTEDKEAFRRTGIAHIFSVSGLHIAFIVAVFSFLAKRLKLPRLAAPFAVFLPVLFYGYIVGFVATATRAIIMAGCAVLLRLLGYRSDTLSSMSLSAVAILLVSPLYLFEGGFLMSFGAVFGIATVTEFLGAKLPPKMPVFFKKILQSVYLSLGASLGALPFVALFYGEVSLVGIFANIIIIPLINAAFIIILVGVLPLPFFNFLLYVPDKLIFVSRFLAGAMNVSFATVNMPSLGIGAVFLFAAFFALSRYVNLRKFPKLIAVSALALLTIFASLLGTFPKNPNDEIRIFNAYPEKAVAAVCRYGDALVFASFRSEYETGLLDEYLAQTKIERLFVFVEDMRGFDAGLTRDFCLRHGVKKIYSLESFPLYDDYEILLAAGIDVQYADGAGGDIRLDKDKGLGFDGYSIEVCGKKILILANVYPFVMTERYFDYDIVYASDEPELIKKAFPQSIVLYAAYTTDKNLLCAETSGHFTFFVKNDMIVVVD